MVTLVQLDGNSTLSEASVLELDCNVGRNYVNRGGGGDISTSTDHTNRHGTTRRAEFVLNPTKQLNNIQSNTNISDFKVHINDGGKCLIVQCSAGF